MFSRKRGYACICLHEAIHKEKIGQYAGEYIE